MEEAMVIEREVESSSGTQLEPKQWTYLSTAGQVILTEEEAFNPLDGRIQVHREYDSSGRLTGQSNPRFSTAAATPIRAPSE